MNHLHKALLSVKHKGHGICSQVDDYSKTNDLGYKELVELYDTLRELFLLWPEGTGSPTYPVPSPDPGLDRVDAFTVCNGAGTLWVGPYGESRKRLLAYLLEQTK